MGTLYTKLEIWANCKQAEKLKSCEMKEVWMKNDKWRRMKDDNFKLLGGFE